LASSASSSFSRVDNMHAHLVAVLFLLSSIMVFWEGV
jgi:hypothetical protein